MSPADIVAEWRKGCSSSRHRWDVPWDCPECTAAAMRAVAHWVEQESARRPGPGIAVRLYATVDPCGRLLVGETERLLPGETWQNAPCERDAQGRHIRSWHDLPGCVTHTIDLVVPCPLITTPQITWRGDVERAEPKP